MGICLDTGEELQASVDKIVFVLQRLLLDSNWAAIEEEHKINENWKLNETEARRDLPNVPIVFIIGKMFLSRDAI